ncbi:response regulator transcription factor [Streptomyces violaceorubidus]
MLRSGSLSLDLRTRRARAQGRTVDLTAREFVLLELFLRHPGQVLSREQILSHVWGYDFDPGSNIVDVYVRALEEAGPLAGGDRARDGYRLPTW